MITLTYPWFAPNPLKIRTSCLASISGSRTPLLNPAVWSNSRLYFEGLREGSLSGLSLIHRNHRYGHGSRDGPDASACHFMALTTCAYQRHSSLTSVVQANHYQSNFTPILNITLSRYVYECKLPQPKRLFRRCVISRLQGGRKLISM